MNTLSCKICSLIFFIVAISCRQTENYTSQNFEGNYVKLKAAPDADEKTLLQIKRLDDLTYVVKLNTATTIAKNKKGILSGEIRTYFGTFPFTIELSNDIALLKVQNKTFAFEKH